MRRSATLVISMLVSAAFFGLPSETSAQAEYAFHIGRLKYGGGGDWYSDPQSLPQLLGFVRQNTNIDVAPREEVVEASSDDLFSYPYLYLTGHGNIRFTDDELVRLRAYLEGGGFLHIDDNYGLDASIRRELRRLYPDHPMVELPFSHEIYHMRFEFPNGLPKIHEHDGKPPQGFGIVNDAGRLVVFYTYETDLGDGWEPESVHHDPPELHDAALKMGTNIMAYALTH